MQEKAWMTEISNNFANELSMPTAWEELVIDAAIDWPMAPRGTCAP